MFNIVVISFFLLDREFVSCMTIVLLTRFQYGASPLGMVGAVGILLALQTNAYMLRIFQTVLADDVGILAYTLEVAAIYLNTWLVGEHLHEDTSLGRVE